MTVVYVTVGTTSFDGLIQAMDNAQVHAALKKRGFTEIVYQIGRGDYEPRCNSGDLKTSFYQFNPHYKEDVRRASLVVSHAGAGSIMDALMENKKLIVVPNTKLMDNHQEELARALASRQQLFSTTCQELLECLSCVQFDNLIPYPTIDEDAFPSFVNGMMGLDGNQ